MAYVEFNSMVTGRFGVGHDVRFSFVLISERRNSFTKINVTRACSHEQTVGLGLHCFFFFTFLYPEKEFIL